MVLTNIFRPFFDEGYFYPAILRTNAKSLDLGGFFFLPYVTRFGEPAFFGIIDLSPFEFRGDWYFDRSLIYLEVSSLAMSLFWWSVFV